MLHKQREFNWYQFEFFIIKKWDLCYLLINLVLKNNLSNAEIYFAAPTLEN